jgi:hypothetical protein
MGHANFAVRSSANLGIAENATVWPYCHWRVATGMPSAPTVNGAAACAIPFALLRTNTHCLHHAPRCTAGGERASTVLHDRPCLWHRLKHPLNYSPDMVDRH